MLVENFRFFFVLIFFIENEVIFLKLVGLWLKCDSLLDYVF